MQAIVLHFQFFAATFCCRSHEIANMSQTLEQFLDSDSYNRTSDFYRTALVILALLFAIVVMFTLVVVTMSTLISVT